MVHGSHPQWTIAIVLVLGGNSVGEKSGFLRHLYDVRKYFDTYVERPNLKGAEQIDLRYQWMEHQEALTC